MRSTACMTFAAALFLAAACGDDGNATATTPTSTTGNTDPTADTNTSAPTTGEADICENPTIGGVMTAYGLPCTVDADCVDAIAPDAKCLFDILGVYSLPCGYCSNLCSLPDNVTTHVDKAADCHLDADCIGLDGYFEGCVPKCTSDADCPREGYECRRLPTISKEGDPTYCLMTEEYKN